MLQTLLKIGEWQSEGKSMWDRFLEYPKIEKKDKYGNPIINYTLPIIFDLDEKEVIISQDNLREYDEANVREALGTKMKGSNSKAICAAGISKRLGRIYQSFYGKEGQETQNGDLIEAIENTNPKLLTENLKEILNRIFDLKDKFLALTVDSSKEKIDIKSLSESFDLNKNERIVYLVTYLKSKEFNYNEPTLFAEITDYLNFLEVTFFGDQEKKDKKKTKTKLCYASGEVLTDVEPLNLSVRYSLNKMFVTETKNYASIFNKKNFVLNYQVSLENQNKLDYASEYLLHQGYKVKIANIDHVIIPQFLSSGRVDLEMALTAINKKSDLLFNLKEYKRFSLDIGDQLESEIFWINFLAFESDGNFFKTTEIIKDVSSFHFNKLIAAFDEINTQFSEAKYIDWDSIMTEYSYDTKEKFSSRLNFNSVFKIIPLRKDKEKKNKALDLFKTILENRSVNKSLLFEYFTELVLCHYYNRQASYTNIKHYSKEYFAFAVRDSVFKYHAFIQFLKKLKLIDMEETNITENQSENKYEQAIQEFFSEMALNKEQKAMFYLGRMLNSVEYIQKGKNKTVIQKVNFNGMDKDDIQRLRISLMEKAKQYNAISKVIFTDNEFGKHFNTNNWNMNPQEAVFFLLTGYSFGIGVKDSEELNQK
ncbi:TM1802 family CRISPR-associated protein [Psychroflexus sp. MBR-150]|jgi:CRISPR-associated protein Csh1